MKHPSPKLPIACAIAALAAAFLILMPWHAVRESHAFDALGCLGSHGGCDVDTSPGPETSDTGYSHTGPLPLLLLLGAAVCAGLAAHLGHRRAWRLGGLGAMLLVIAAGVDVAATTVIAHLFDEAKILLPEVACACAGLAAFILAILVISRAPPRFVRPGIPTARVVS